MSDVFEVAMGIVWRGLCGNSIQSPVPRWVHCKLVQESTSVLGGGGGREGMKAMEQARTRVLVNR